VRTVRHPPVRITGEKRAEVVRLLKEGRSCRHITFVVGCAPNTVNYILHREGIERPPCGCGRPGGHKGMCAARRGPQNDRPHSPKNFRGQPAGTQLGKIIDEASRALDLLPTEIARAAGISGLRMTQIRLGGYFAAIVSPKVVDALAAAIGGGEARRIEMHYAAAIDYGYRLPPLGEVAEVPVEKTVSIVPAEEDWREARRQLRAAGHEVRQYDGRVLVDGTPTDDPRLYP
jgi:hypothetical protein